MRLIVAAAAVAQLAAATVDVHSVLHKPTANTVPGKYIVQLSQGSHIKRGFTSPHAELYHDLDARGAGWQVTKEYSGELLTGAAIQLVSRADLIKLAQAPGVESIYPVYIRSLPRPPSAAAVAPPSINPVVVDTFSTHQMTGVNKLHGQGYFGKGIKIGIIDTGIDYTHPALGGKYGPGNKVVGGYDLVGDDYTGAENSPDPKPDNDPLDQCNGHGTHVAGIIGADSNNPYNITGVAPEASLTSYRVFGCSGSTADDIIVDAMMHAYNDNNDIITMSLGGPEGWSEGVTSVVASKIADKGKVVTIAAGNEGDYGSWYASGPATGISAISVGSVDNTIVNIQNATVSNGRAIPYYSFLPLQINGSLPIYPISNDTTVANDACNPLPASTPDLSNYLVLIRRGSCAFTQKLGNAAAFGANAFLIYNNVEEPLSGITVGNHTAALITQADGVYLIKEAIPAGAKIEFTNRPYALPATTGGLMSSFSTYGPSYDMYFKPAFSAPGGNILSTYPVPLGAYAVESGTSMATPFAAGSAALLLQIRGKTADVAKSARAIFQNTASLIPFDKTNTSIYETASHAGAGLIQVYDAIYNMGCMLPAELLLNDTAYFKGQQSVTIKNGGKKAVTYTLEHIPAGTAPTIDGIENIPGPVPLVKNAATVTFSKSSMTLQPGSSAKIDLTFRAPTGLDAKTFPVYSGFIRAKGSDNTFLHSTYLGVAAALKDMKIIDNTDAYFGVKLPFIADKDGNPVNGTTTYSMQGNDTPAVLYRLVAGTPLLRIDLMNSATNVTANQRRSLDAELETRELSHALSDDAIAKRGVLDWILPKTPLAKLTPGAGTFAQVSTLGVLYSEDYLYRNSDAATAADNGYTDFPVTAFANGTAIPDGKYKILVRAAKITSDVSKEENYEVWTSPEFVVKK